MRSKIAQAAGGVGVIGGSEAISQANEAAEQVRALKDNAAEIGLIDWLGHLVQSPRFLAAVAVVALVGVVIYFRWRDHGRGREFDLPRRALAQARSAARQSGSPRRTLAQARSAARQSGSPRRTLAQARSAARQ